jgi:hypothetical protein
MTQLQSMQYDLQQRDHTLADAQDIFKSREEQRKKRGAQALRWETEVQAFDTASIDEGGEKLDERERRLAHGDNRQEALVG